jgi:hypothetical protein
MSRDKDIESCLALIGEALPVDRIHFVQVCCHLFPFPSLPSLPSFSFLSSSLTRSLRPALRQIISVPSLSKDCNQSFGKYLPHITKPARRPIKTPNRSSSRQVLISLPLWMLPWISSPLRQSPQHSAPLPQSLAKRSMEEHCWPVGVGSLCQTSSLPWGFINQSKSHHPSPSSPSLTAVGVSVTPRISKGFRERLEASVGYTKREGVIYGEGEGREAGRGGGMRQEYS